MISWSKNGVYICKRCRISGTLVGFVWMFKRYFNLSVAGDTNVGFRPDTHGYDEVNFAAFAMLGKTFSPRIKNIKSQWLYKINQDKDYGNLSALLKGANHTSKLNYVVDQWDRMGQFYASLATGQATASTALKRLTSSTEKNHFYQANVELGRILKTEHILLWMSDPARRKRARKGLLKVEQIHQLARD